MLRHFPGVPFDMQPVLLGDTLTVRPLHPTDFDALYAVARDPLIWEQHPDDRYRRETFERFFADSLASGGALLVSSAMTGAVVGTSRYHGYDEQRSEVEIGWTFLARSHWGGPANRALKSLMLEHAFRSVERVIFVVAPDNHRSQRALEKLGAARIGIRSSPGRTDVVFELRRAPGEPR